MWDYQKRLQYPVKIRTCNPKLAKFIISQYGGPDEPPILLRNGTSVEMKTIC